MSVENLDKAATVVAQQNAMERSCVFLPHGTRLFQVEAGWESAMIRKDRGVTCCDTLLSFEAALRDPECKVIFIPDGALMTGADIEKVCQRNGATKTIFQEVRVA